MKTEIELRRTAMFERREAGATFAAIGREFGVSTATAKYDCDREQRRRKYEDKRLAAGALTGLSVRANNILYHALGGELPTREALEKITFSELLDVENCGAVTQKEILDAMDARGWKFKDHPQSTPSRKRNLSLRELARHFIKARANVDKEFYGFLDATGAKEDAGLTKEEKYLMHFIRFAEHYYRPSPQNPED